MIRKCTKDDKDFLNKYLYIKKEINLFVIGDIENYGFENENLEIFIDIEEELKTIYLRFFDSLCLVSYDLIIDINFLNKLIKENNIGCISGEKSLIEKINLTHFSREDCFFASLNQLKYNYNTEGVVELSIDKINEYLKKVKEVFNIESNIKTIKSELEKKSKHIYVYMNNNQIVSSASSSAESSKLAMLVGVFTIEGYRRKGYAQKCVYSLCKRLIYENKTVCLFYENPNAAKMYKKLGFKDIGLYSMLKKK